MPLAMPKVATVPDSSFRPAGLYAITPDEPDEARLLGLAKSALVGGARLLQYRDKTGDAGAACASHWYCVACAVSSARRSS